MTRTLAQALADSARLLAASPSPRLDAEVLLGFVCNLDRAGLITHAGRALGAAQDAALRGLLARRRDGEPVAYLTGHREFWSLDLAVTADTLIPRPETELLVEHTLARIPRDASWTVADLGTGSGAVAAAIACERPRCRLIATDVSRAALAVAQANARRLGIANLEFRSGSWCRPLAGECVDVIVSNPPYVRDDDPHLEQGDVRFEPELALRAGTDGLDAIRRIAHDAGAHLRAGGWLLLEHGCDQAGDVAGLLAGGDYDAIDCHPDLSGQARVTLGRRR